MQTPLAVCSNRLETLMEDESLSEQQLTELAKTHQTLEYLSKLNKTLLLLSKIDNNQFLNKTELNINSLVSKISQDYAEVYAYKNISLEIKELGQLQVVMDETIAGVLINNLLKNSYVHNAAGGAVVIEVYTSKLIIMNTSDYAALDSDLIFDRFYQGTKKEGSTGLGLALISSIVKAENLRINYFYRNDMHGFEINFKK
jgi:two-component system, OmpR family, sensor histidine kinase QseC